MYFHSLVLITYTFFFFHLLQDNAKKPALIQNPSSKIRFQGPFKGVMKGIRSSLVGIFNASISISHADSKIFQHNILCTFNNSHLKSWHSFTPKTTA